MSLIDALLLEPAPLNLWLAWRTDGIKGSGTHSDPYDASTMLATPDTPTTFAASAGDAREIVVTLSTAGT